MTHGADTRPPGSRTRKEHTCLLSPGIVLGIALSGQLRLNLEIYRSEGGGYTEEPTIRRKIRRFASFAGPTAHLGDAESEIAKSVAEQLQATAGASAGIRPVAVICVTAPAAGWSHDSAQGKRQGATGSPAGPRPSGG